MTATPSFRQLWVMYKRISMARGGAASRRDLILAHCAFYGGARGVLRVLAHLLEHGEVDELRRFIERQRRLIDVVRGPRTRARRH